MRNFDICIIAVAGDASVANKLADSIRKYRLPSGVVLPDSGLDYRRVYVDVSGRELDDDTRDVLDNSRFLAVLCSPETKASPFILERLEYFRKIGKDNNIIVVIVRGEPIDSFPESFIEKKTVQKILPDMTVVEHVETSGLGVEDDDVLLFVGLDIFGHVGGAVILQEVGWRDGQLHHVAHGLTGSATRSIDLQTIEQM